VEKGGGRGRKSSGGGAARLAKRRRRDMEGGRGRGKFKKGVEGGEGVEG